MARGQHPNSIANLKRVPKGGPSPNPSGRPKDILTQTLRRLVDEREAETLVTALLAASKDGDMKALALIWERLEGKVAQSLDVKAEVTVQRIAEVEVALPKDSV